MEILSVATAKKKLSECISKVEINGSRMIISRRSKPVAALVSIEDLAYINTKDESGGLSEAVGKWNGFGDIEKDIRKIFRSRRDDGERKVSL